jgi:hypothetical protein
VFAIAGRPVEQMPLGGGPIDGVAPGRKQVADERRAVHAQLDFHGSFRTARDETQHAGDDTAVALAAGPEDGVVRLEESGDGYSLPRYQL